MKKYGRETNISSNTLRKRGITESQKPVMVTDFVCNVNEVVLERKI
jgi:glycosylphosphatidylinositol transamidase (GPIT) subunit GPI8